MIVDKGWRKPRLPLASLSAFSALLQQHGVRTVQKGISKQRKVHNRHQIKCGLDLNKWYDHYCYVSWETELTKFY